MKIFYATFNGINPVGACAIIVAETKLQAVNTLRAGLDQANLLEKNDTEENPLEDELVEIDMTKRDFHMILDGNY